MKLPVEFWANRRWSRGRQRHATTLRPPKWKLSRSTVMRAPISSKRHGNTPLHGIGKDRKGRGARDPRIKGQLRERKAAATRRQRNRRQKARRTDWTRRSLVRRRCGRLKKRRSRAAWKLKH